MNDLAAIRRLERVPSGLRKFRAAAVGLWAGFVTPSSNALLLMLASCAAPGLAVCLLITPRLLAGPMGIYLPSAQDTEASATRKALTPGNLPLGPANPQRLCVLGDSVLAHSFADEAATAAQLRRATGRPWQAIFLTTGDQDPLERAALADYATRPGPCVVVLPLSFERRMSAGEIIRLDSFDRLGVSSPWADAVRLGLGRGRRPTGVYAIDHGHFLLREAPGFIWRLVTQKPETTAVDAYAPKAPLSSPELARRRLLIVASLKDQTDSRLSEHLLGDLVARLKARGARVEFVEEEFSPALFATPYDLALYQAYLDRSARAAVRLGGSYCRLSDAYQPPAEQYPDFLHLTDRQSQSRLRAALAQCVARSMSGPGGVHG